MLVPNYYPPPKLPQADVPSYGAVFNIGEADYTLEQVQTVTSLPTGTGSSANAVLILFDALYASPYTKIQSGEKADATVLYSSKILLKFRLNCLIGGQSDLCRFDFIKPRLFL